MAKLTRKAERQDIGKLIERRLQLKAEEAAIKETMSELDSSILAELERRGEKTVTVPVGDGNVQVTRVQTESAYLDEDELAERIGTRKYNALFTEVTIKRFDEDKLQAAVQSGRIDAEDVQAATEIRQGKPYVKMTNRTAPKEEGK